MKIVTKLYMVISGYDRDISHVSVKDQGQGHQRQHIIIDHSGMNHRRNAGMGQNIFKRRRIRIVFDNILDMNNSCDAIAYFLTL